MGVCARIVEEQFMVSSVQFGIGISPRPIRLGKARNACADHIATGCPARNDVDYDAHPFAVSHARSVDILHLLHLFGLQRLDVGRRGHHIVDSHLHRTQQIARGSDGFVHIVYLDVRQGQHPQKMVARGRRLDDFFRRVNQLAVNAAHHLCTPYYHFSQVFAVARCICLGLQSCCCIESPTH